MALWGYSDKLFSDNNGIFLWLVQLLGKYDEVMGEHLRCASSKAHNDHFCGKTIENQLIVFMAKEVSENIESRLYIAKYYSVILVCTPDINPCKIC